jgi:hypothetical protein
MLRTTSLVFTEQRFYLRNSTLIFYPLLKVKWTKAMLTKLWDDSKAQLSMFDETFLCYYMF